MRISYKDDELLLLLSVISVRFDHGIDSLYESENESDSGGDDRDESPRVLEIVAHKNPPVSVPPASTILVDVFG